MFSVKFCVCFHMILNLCHSHFSGNTYENCTKKINFIPKNGTEVKITEKNYTTEENQGKTVTNTTAGINRKGVEVNAKTNEVTRRKKNDNIDEGTEKLMVKESHSLSEKRVTLFDLDITENKKSNISFNRSEERTDHKNQNRVLEDIGKLAVTKEAAVEKLSSKITNGSLTGTDTKNLTKNHTDNVQIYSLSKNVKKYNLGKNDKNETMTLNATNYFEGNSTNKNVHKNDLLKKENNSLHMKVKNETHLNATNVYENINTKKNVKKYNSGKNNKHQPIIGNEIILSEKNSKDQNVQKSDLPKKENYDLYKNDNNKTITENMNIYLQNNSTDQNVEKYGMPKSNTISENVTKSMEINSMDKTNQENNVPKNEKNNMSKNIQKYDSPKNVQKRDISNPENVSSDEKARDFQKNDDTTYEKFNSHDKYENIDIEKNRHNDNTPKKLKHHNKHVHKPNADKFHNYQNYDANYKNIIDKNELDNKKHSDFDDNVSNYVLKQKQSRLDKDLIKKSLDEFKMVRRKTHYTFPPFDFKDNSMSNIDHYQDPDYNQDYGNKARMNAVKNKLDTDFYKENQNYIYPSYDERNYESYESRDMPHYQELNSLLARQKEIVRQLARIQLVGRQKDLAFDSLLQEVKAKQENYKTWKNYTKFTFEKTTTVTTTIKTTTAKPTTVLTLFDETEIRRALKNDPQIKRILKLANLKRKKYLDNVRSYLISNNYAQDIENAKKLTERGSGGLREKATESANLNNKF